MRIELDPLYVGRYQADLFRRDARPARDRAADRAPPAKALVNLRRDHRLLPERQAVGLDLRVRDVTDGEPARRAFPHVGGRQSEDRISLSQTSPSPCSL